MSRDMAFQAGEDPNFNNFNMNYQMHNTMYPGGFDKETGLSKVRMRNKRG